MNQYDSYKPSGIDWIGDIPSHWGVKRLKYTADVQPSNVDKKSFEDEETVLLCNYMDVYRNEYIDDNISFMQATATPEEITKFTIEKGDVLVTKDSETPDDIANATCVRANLKNVLCGYHLTHIRPDKRQLEGSFLFRLFYADRYKGQFQVAANGVTRFGLNVAAFTDAYVPLPPLIEQVAIARYLDTQTTQLDTLIDRKRRLMELLREEKTALINEAVTKGIKPGVEMKDSGIDWLGEVPAHWEVTRVKYVCKIQGRIGFKGYKTSDLVPTGEGAMVLGSSHITKTHKINVSEPIFLSWDKYYESPEIMVRKGDIVFSQRGAYLGKVGLIEEEFGEVTINPSLILIKEITINGTYLSRYLTSGYVVENVNVISSSTAIPMISQEQLENFNCLAPPLAEQAEIVAYLNTETTRIDYTVSRIEREVELMQEYRTALISEVVTGKVCILANEPVA